MTRKPRALDDSKKTKAQLIEEITMLREALDAISDGFVVFDADDRVIAFNTKHQELFPSFADVLAVGLPYQELLKVQVNSGQFAAARGREQAWVDDWIERHQIADGTPLEQDFSSGRTIRLSEHRTPSGGIVAVRTDITDLKDAQRRLQESEQRFREFAEVSADWFWEIDAAGKLVWRSENPRLAPDRTFKDVEGLTREQISGDAMADEQWEPYRQALRKRCEFKDFECRYPMSGGHIRTALLSGKPIFDDAGRYSGHRGVASDITARKSAEQARLESEEQYRDLAQLNPDAFIIQVDGKITFANDSACRMFRVESVEQLIGMDSLLIVHPDHRDAILQARDQAMESDERSPYREFGHLRLDGQSFPSEMIAGPIDWQGRRGTMNIIHDVTVRKQATEKLRASEMALAEAQRIGHIGHWRLLCDTGQLEWSGEMYRIFGVDENTFSPTKANVGKVMHRQDRVRMSEIQETAIARGQPYRFEHRILWPNSEVRVVSGEGRPELDDKGNVVSVFGVTQDTTDRKAAEAAVVAAKEEAESANRKIRRDVIVLEEARKRAEESEQNFRTLLETAPIPLVLVSDGDYVYANQKTHTMLDVPTGQLIGRTARDFYVDRDVRDQAVALLEKNDRLEGYEAEIQRDNGRRIWVTLSAATIRYMGRTTYFVGMLDITAHKQAEEALQESERRFRAIAESSPIPLTITKRSDGTVLYANTQVEPVLGVSRSNLVGERIGKFLANPSSQDARVAAIEERGFVDRSIIEMQRPDGTRLPTMHSLRAIVFDGVPAIVGAFLDITEQQRVELDLRRAKEVAEAADASKTQFLAVMSHELRTPLNAIIGFSEMMEQQVLGPLGHEHYVRYAADIQRSGEHLLALISDILDLSRIEAGHLERDETVFGLAEVIDECLRYVRGRAEENGIAVNTHLPDPCPRLTADKRQTKQIVLNLLTNAVKFTAAGSTIDVHVETVQSGDLRLRVVDQGAGIPDHELERIMEPFTRLEGSHTSRVDGTGLGLAIVKRLVEGHGGQLKLISEVGHGTEAVVNFRAERVLAGE